MAIHPGDILAGYRVTRLLGRGGMGEVWGAVDDRTGRDVALKVLLQRAAMKPDLVKRFEREAKITSAIKSPFVCQLYEVTQTDEGAHLLVFEQLAGESLSDRLKRETYLPLGEVGIIIDDVLNGLVAAHAAGVIHRDLKPGNIFLERVNDPKRPERAKILDFGISKITGHGEKEPTLTAFDATLGSFAYMAPEQIRGAARADERADIYAVGAVAFRALAGRLPFEGTSAAVLVSLKLDRSAPTLEVATGEKWPAGVERFLEKALARQREQRFASASEALEAWRASQPGNITKVKLPPSHPPSRKGDAPPSQRPPSQRAPSPRAPMPPTSQRAMPPTSQRAVVAEPPEASPIVPAFPEDMPTEVDDHPPTMDGWAEPQRAHPPRTKDTRENTGRSTRISRAGRKQGGR